MKSCLFTFRQPSKSRKCPWPRTMARMALLDKTCWGRWCRRCASQLEANSSRFKFHNSSRGPAPRKTPLKKDQYHTLKLSVQAQMTRKMKSVPFALESWDSDQRLSRRRSLTTLNPSRRSRALSRNTRAPPVTMCITATVSAYGSQRINSARLAERTSDLDSLLKIIY